MAKPKKKSLVIGAVELGKLEKLGLLEALDCIQSTSPRVKLVMMSPEAAEKEGLGDAPRTCVCDNEALYNGFNCRTRYKKLRNGWVVVVSDLP